MLMKTHRSVTRFNPFMDIHALKQECKDKADAWELTYRSSRPFNNYRSGNFSRFFSRNKIQIQRLINKAEANNEHTK